jgi:hypothetical protein
VEDVNATEPGLKPQVLCGGKYKHIEGVRAVDPVKPFCAVKVNVVDPDWPGLAMLMVVALAAIVKVAPTSITATGEVDPLKFGSPLYCTVMLSAPDGNCVVVKLATGGMMLESMMMGPVRAVPLE